MIARTLQELDNFFNFVSQIIADEEEEQEEENRICGCLDVLNLFSLRFLFPYHINELFSIFPQIALVRDDNAEGTDPVQLWIRGRRKVKEKQKPRGNFSVERQ